MRKTSRRAWRVVGGGVGAVTLLGIGYVATRWLRYGHVRKRPGPPSLLDRFSRNAKSWSGTRLAWLLRRTSPTLRHAR